MAVQENTTQKLERTLLKPAVVGAIGAGTLLSMPGASYQTISVPGLGQMPAWAVYGTVIGFGSFLGETAHSWVFPSLHVSERFEEPASLAVSAGLAGGATALACDIVNPKVLEVEGMKKLVAIGALAEITGDYLFTKVVSPMLFAQ